jgi:hypothetical protein
MDLDPQTMLLLLSLIPLLLGLLIGNRLRNNRKEADGDEP